MKLKGYYCTNEAKVDRAINGTIGSGGQLEGGVGVKATEGEKLAAYDKLGGQILNKDKRLVKMGSFHDFAKKTRHKKGAKVILLFKNLKGRTVEMDEKKAVSPELLAAEEMDNEEKEEKAKKREDAAKLKKAKADKKAAAKKK